MSASLVDDFDPFPRRTQAEAKDITNQSIDPLQSLQSASSSSLNSASTSNSLQEDITKRANERQQRVFDDLHAQPWGHHYHHHHHQQQSGSPPRRLSSIMTLHAPPHLTSSASNEGLVRMSPTEADVYHPNPGSPPHTVRRRLSQSLVDSDNYFFGGGAFTSRPQQTSPPPPAAAQQSQHLQQQQNNTQQRGVRPALVNLFSSASSSSFNKKPVQEESERHVPSRAQSLPVQHHHHHHHQQQQPLPNRRSPVPPAPITLIAPPGLSSILTSDIAEALRPSLPSRLRIAAQWSLLYSLDAHGVSLSTLYSRVEQGMNGRGHAAGLLLVVKDHEGYVFGAFVNEKLRRTEGFYGSGECFLWKAMPFPKGDVRLGMGTKVFNWTGRNNYVVQSDDEFISVGGGRDGKFGLWIDASFEEGYSTRCLTFDNQVLSGPEGSARSNGVDEGRRFQVNRVEVWRIGQ